MPIYLLSDTVVKGTVQKSSWIKEIITIDMAVRLNVFVMNANHMTTYTHNTI